MITTRQIFPVLCSVTVLCIALLSAGNTQAQEKEIPEVLQPWQGWVLWDQQDTDSPRPFNAYKQPIRVWPSRLRLTAEKEGGVWQIDVQVFEAAWVALPGDAKSWPQNVRVGDNLVPVVERNGFPAARLAAGSHQLSGEFHWNVMPQRIAVPKAIGLLTLKVNDEDVAIPNWDVSGRVWLKRASVEAAQKNLLSAQVYRVIEDGIPLWLQTEIELTVSGKSREEEMGNILPAGWQLSYVESPIPVAIDNQGRMKTQVRAGKWRIKVQAFRNTPIDTFRFSPESQPVTKSELVGFRDKPDFRIAELEGAQQVDVSQTTFPNQWRSLPVYQWTTDSELKLVEKQRGMGDQGLTGLEIRRQLWLDEDGQGFTYRDTITGQMQQLWRLDATKGQELGAVRANGQPQLITTNPKTDLTGVEIRDRNLKLDAVGRVPLSDSLSAIGWEADADSLQLSFSLPPGWRVLALLGADSVNGDWLTAWTLLDLFLLLVFSVAVFKLMGLYAGLIALLAFGLSYHDPYSPRYTWFFLLIPIALLRVVPEGTIKGLLNGWKWMALILLLFYFVPFSVRQIQTALYPQLELSNAYYGQRGMLSRPARMNARFGTRMIASNSNNASREVIETAAMPRSRFSVLDSLSSKRESVQKGMVQLSKSNMFQSSDARVQTGCAVPQWDGNQVTCYWSGRVKSDQQIRLVLLSCQMHRLLTVGKLVLLFLLTAVLLGVAKLRLPSLGRGGSAAVVLLAVLFTSNVGYAQNPDSQMLETLRRRLSEPSTAFPHAADIATVDLKLNDGRITMTAEIHAATAVAVPLPGRLPSWSPLSITLDGEPNALVCRRPDGYLWVTVPQGVHTVVVEGLLAETSEWEWTFVLPPRQVTIDAPGWNVTGVDRNGVPGKQAFFTKQEKRTDEEATYDQKNFRAVTAVERRVEVGLVWKVHTTVRRLSAPGKAISLKIPLLPGESVLSGNLVVEDDKIEVNLAANQSEFTWESEIAPTQELKFQAADSAQWVERWRLVTSPVWNVAFSDLTPIYQVNETSLTPEWRPWPGESMTLTFTRPEAVPGQTMTVQEVTHATDLGARQRNTELTLQVESSLGSDFVLDFDANAEVRSLTVNDKKTIARRNGRQLIIPVRPGKQSISLTYITPLTIGTVALIDSVKLPVDGANVTTTVRISRNRWVLWAQGPLRGPAVRFWVILVCAVLVALALGSLSLSPLGRVEWVLLIIGLTQVPLFAAMLVIGWLFLLAWRGKQEPGDVSYWRFNLMQVAIVLLTIASLAILVVAVGEGLLGNPDMFIIGNDSSQTTLNWFQPRTGLELPQPMVVSVSVWFYRLLMLFWALWLAVALLRWLQMGWTAFSKGGFMRHASKATISVTKPQQNEGAESNE